jgi:hypothetical protein
MDESSTQHRALYYPDLAIRDPTFLFEALLYWDRLACIHPSGETPGSFLEGFGWRTNRDGELGYETEMLHAMHDVHEEFVSPLVPTEAQKLEVHHWLSDLASTPCPPWLRPEHLRTGRRTVILPQKFMSDTIWLLEHSGWLRRYGSDRYAAEESVAMLIMGALAEACASPTLSPITDDPGAYATSCNELLLTLGQREAGLTPWVRPQSHFEGMTSGSGALVLLAVKRLGVKEEPMSAEMLLRLRDLRRDQVFNAHRESFCRRIDGYVAQLAAVSDQEGFLVLSDLALDIDRDAKSLKAELHQAGLNAITGKEGIIATVAVATGAAVALAGGAALAAPIVALIGLGAGAVNAVGRFRRDRKEVRAGHWTSWLFSVEGRRVGLW